MNGEFRLQDAQLFKNDLDSLDKIASEIANTEYGIANPDTTNARSHAGDNKRNYDEEDVRQILKIKRKSEVKRAKEIVNDIKKKYGVTIVIPDYEV